MQPALIEVAREKTTPDIAEKAKAFHQSSSHASNPKSPNPSMGLQAKPKMAREQRASCDLNSQLSQRHLFNGAVSHSRSQHARSAEGETLGGWPDTAPTTSTSDIQRPNSDKSIVQVSPKGPLNGHCSDTVSNSKRIANLAEGVVRPVEDELEADEDDLEEDNRTDLDRGEWEWMKGKVRPLLVHATMRFAN